MPKNSPRRSSPHPFKLLFQQLVRFQSEVEQSLHNRHRTQKLRRLRRRRIIGTSHPTRQSLISAFRSISWPRSRRRRSRTRQATQSPPQLRTLVFASAQSQSTPKVVALVSRHAATALFLFAFLSTVFTAIPLRLNAANWYLNVLGVFAENVPIFLLVALLSVLYLALYGDSADAVS